MKLLACIVVLLTTSTAAFADVAPEIQGASSVAAIGILSGALMVLRSRRSK